MIELPFIVFSGFLGSMHCIGMCGPLVLALGMNENRVKQNLARQLTFSVGRIFTYGFIGALAAYGGVWLADQPIALVNVQAVLAIVVGLFLVLLGLASTGVLPAWPGMNLPHIGCTSWLKTFLTSPGLTNAFLAGIFTGFLPCGLVYIFVALAVATGSILKGWLTMVAFGIGTVPLMVLAGCGSSWLSFKVRNRVLQVAAWCVVVTGIISVARGMGFLQLTADAVPAGCPLCN